MVTHVRKWTYVIISTDPVLLNTGSKLDPLFIIPYLIHSILFFEPKKGYTFDSFSLHYTSLSLSLCMFLSLSPPWLFHFHAQVVDSQKKNHSHQTLLNNTTIAFIYIGNYSTTNYQFIVHHLNGSSITEYWIQAWSFI